MLAMLRMLRKERYLGGRGNTPVSLTMSSVNSHDSFLRTCMVCIKSNQLHIRRGTKRGWGKKGYKTFNNECHQIKLQLRGELMMFQSSF